jgi:hypothetical protein
MSSIPRDLFWGLAFLLALAGAETALILALNQGHFTYSLDDPYIHLALAENILRGHYGVNLAEFSSPSSSILWAFLLAPFSLPPLGIYVPLLLNLGSAVATVCVLRAVLARALGPAVSDRGRGFVLALLVVAFNLAGLIFTGMEHSLQVLLASVVAWGLILESEENRVPGWLAAAIVLGPLVRYESLALSLAALAYLTLRGRFGRAALLAVATVLPLLLFSLFLIRLGLDPFPVSVRAKTGVTDLGPLPALFANLKATLTGDRGTWLLAGALALAGCVLLLRESRRRILAGAALLALPLHFAAGKYDGYSRYELYIWVFTFSVLLCLAGPVLASAALGRRKAGVALLLAMGVGTVCFRYVGILVTTPLAANNVYQQQFQMHRFAVDYYRKPVAVNDLGYVAYANTRYVLDLGGLASPEALRFREMDPDAAGKTRWMNDLAAAKGVEFAMIFQSWFEEDIPASWVKVGTLTMSGPRVAPPSREVAFFATNPRAASEASAKLREFRKSLPPGAAFTFTP